MDTGGAGLEGWLTCNLERRDQGDTARHRQSNGQAQAFDRQTAVAPPHARPSPPHPPQVVGDDLSKTAPLDLAFWNKAQSALSAQGLRVLALTRCVWGG